MNTSQPVFSFIIPTYKAEFFIEETLNSILEQTFQDFEVLIVSDGSPGVSLQSKEWTRDSYKNKYIPTADIQPGDQCQWVIEQIGDKRIHFTKQKNAKAGFARNTAIDMASGTYLVFLDSDDILPSDYLEIAYRELQSKKDDELIFAGMRMFNSDTGEQYPYPQHAIATPWPNNLKTLLLFPNWTTTPVNYFWEREYFNQHNIRYTVSQPSEDLDIALEALKHWKGSMSFRPINTYQLYRVHETQFSKFNEEGLMKMYTVLGKKHTSWMSKHGWREALLIRLFIARSIIYAKKLKAKPLPLFFLNICSKLLTASSLVLSGARLLKPDEELFKNI